MPKLNLNDTAVRALHTFWQAFLGLLVAALSTGGITLSGIHSLSDAKALLGVVVAVVVASAASAVKSTIVNMTGLDVSDGTGPGSSEPLEAVATNSAGISTPTPADPEQPAAGTPPPPA